MSNDTLNTAAILRPESVQALVVEPVSRQSVAFQVSTVVNISTEATRFPKVTGDPDAAWTPEGTEIPVDGLEVDEVVAQPVKLAALSVVTSELAADSTPAAERVIGDAITRSIVAKVDAAYFADTTANGPSGLLSVSGRQNVYAGVNPTNTDSFIEAIAAAENVGVAASDLTFVTDPATALQLAKLKKLSSGSNEPLLTSDAASPTGRQIAGVPLLVSPHVPTAPSKVVWAIPRSRSFVVVRAGTTLVTDSSAFFSSDRVAIRATTRLTFAFPHQAAIVAVRLANEGS